MGVAGKLNDAGVIPTSIYSYWPNEIGLYNMAGNVNEWVHDVYRPGSYQDMDDLNPIRIDGSGDPAANYDAQWSFIGNEGPYTLDQAVAAGMNPKEYDAENPPTRHYRVYKGGSWQDVAYWLAPGTRRAASEDEATSAIGFRCAMIRAGLNY